MASEDLALCVVHCNRAHFLELFLYLKGEPQNTSLKYHTTVMGTHEPRKTLSGLNCGPFQSQSVLFKASLILSLFL